MRQCKDCPADISHRHILTQYCHDCHDRRHRESCKKATEAKRLRGEQYEYPIQDRVCNICEEPVRHYLKDARSCKPCRDAVLQMSDAMCEGAVGDPATYEHFDEWEKEEKSD